ncbi:MAG: hypothetical protein ACE37D_08085 [Pseudomonadales bacterium]
MKSSTQRLVSSKLLIWGNSNFQNFPWRDIENPWLALLAEVLLQRTNAKHVEKYFHRVALAFPTPESVINARHTKLDEIEAKFGLKRRLRTLLELAEFIDTQDIYPTDYESLTNVYGIGHYTAAAYLSLHMNQRAVLVDSNIARWLSRLTDQEKPVDVRRCKWLWELAEKLTPRKGFKDYNYAVLDFSMMVCRPRRPKCEECPLAKLCKFKREQ